LTKLVNLHYNVILMYYILESAFMFSIRLPKHIEIELMECAKELDRPKSKIVNEALSLYLEDLKDYIKANKVLAKNEPTISHEDLKRELGI
jgi:predicted DNA-binding protein